jgi:hypothetical protein
MIPAGLSGELAERGGMVKQLASQMMEKATVAPSICREARTIQDYCISLTKCRGEADTDGLPAANGESC